jgi:hypothetical protein
MTDDGHQVMAKAHIAFQTWPPQAILVSDWPILKNLLLKPLGQINRNLVGSIYGRSS